MDLAKHTSKNKTKDYVYYEFELLNESDRKKLKPGLRCYYCTAQITFAVASVSGAQAYFKLRGGQKHDKSCDEVKQEASGVKSRRKREEKYFIEEVEKIRNDSNIIDIDTTGGAQFEEETPPEKQKATKNKKRKSSSTQSTKIHIIKSDNTRHSNKTLIQLLKYCLYSKSFVKDDNLKVRFKGREYDVKSRFKNFFSVASITNTKLPYFFWGRVKNINDSLQYVYVGSDKKATVIIDKKIKEQLWRSMRVNKHWQLIDAQIICWGWLSNKTGKPLVVVKNLSDIAFIDVKPNPSFTNDEETINTVEDETAKTTKNSEVEFQYEPEQHNIDESGFMGIESDSINPSVFEPEPKPYRKEQNTTVKTVSVRATPPFN